MRNVARQPKGEVERPRNADSGRHEGNSMSSDSSGTSSDFPYYDGQPVAVSALGWCAILAGVAIGFATLVSFPAASFPATLVPALLFVLIPLGFLAAVTGRHWKALFGRVGPRQIGQMIGFGLLTIAVSVVVGYIVSKTIGANANPIVDQFSTLSWAGLGVMLIPTVPQLVGEEILTILPFLALLWLMHARLGLSRNTSVVLALIGSSVLFAVAHLPTYQWNWGQVLGIIGSARIVLTLAYIWSKNLWVSAGAHIINDWTEFLFVYLQLGNAPE
jgi:membrane protease YdiL (CAAX protease family)